MKTIAPFSHPLYATVKPVGARCNLLCNYCYYLEKVFLYPDPASHLMSEEMLEHFTRDYIEAQTVPEVLFTWHGGEPLMHSIAFYKKAMEFQKKYAQGRKITNTIQTNGTLLTDEWCEFFSENDWLVGVSIDGPQEFHDEYRRCRKDDRRSFDIVMKGVALLNIHEVKWNALVAVHDLTANYPAYFYRFFKGIKCHHIQFTPVVERLLSHRDGRILAHVKDKNKCRIANWSVTPEQWGDFICDLFNEWVKKDVGKYFIQLFDATLANWMGVEPGVCTMAKTCGHAAAVEFNGDVYSCDHFVFPEYKLGNIKKQSLLEMMYGKKQDKFSALKQQLPMQCKTCEYLFACNGECPRNRFAYADDGEPGLNFLCDGYIRFFKHVAPYMDFMRNELLENRSPANVMQAIRGGLLPPPIRRD
jgi:uncharacterized protein